MHQPEPRAEKMPSLKSAKKRTRRTADAKPTLRKHASGQAWAWFGQDCYFGTPGRDADRLFVATLKVWEDNGRQLPDNWFELAAALVESDHRDTFDELAADYLDHLYTLHGERDRGDRIKDAARIARRVGELLGRKPAADFDDADFAVIVETFRALPGKGGKRRSVGTVKKDLGALRSMFRYGIARHGTTPAQDASLLLLIQSQRKDAQLRSKGAEAKLQADPARVAEVLNHPRITATVCNMVQFTALTGARPGEVPRLRACDVHDRRTWERSQGIDVDTEAYENLTGVQVAASLKMEAEGDRADAGKVFVPFESKTDRHEDAPPRVIYLNKAAEALVEKLIEGKRPTEFVFSPKQNWVEQKAADPRLGGRPSKGTEYDDNSYGQLIRRACLRAFPYPDEIRRTYPETDAQWRKRLRETKDPHGDGTLWDAKREHEQREFFTPIQLRKLYLQIVRKYAGRAMAAKQAGHTVDSKMIERYTGETFSEGDARGLGAIIDF